jgi:hypothetical protein
MSSLYLCSYLMCLITWPAGGYDKEDKAARAYDLAALKYWGPSTTINFPVLIPCLLPNYSQSLLHTNTHFQYLYSCNIGHDPVLMEAISLTKFLFPEEPILESLAWQTGSLAFFFSWDLTIVWGNSWALMRQSWKWWRTWHAKNMLPPFVGNEPCWISQVGFEKVC